MSKMILASMVLLAAGLSACTPPQVMIGHRFSGRHGDGTRVVRYAIEPSGQSTDETGSLYNLFVHICGQNDDGTEDNCKETLVLDNVVPGSVY